MKTSDFPNTPIEMQLKVILQLYKSNKDRANGVVISEREKQRIRLNNHLNVHTENNSRDKTDHDVIREHHKFLWDETEDSLQSWETRLAKKYYDKLFKEYCICDLTYYKYNKVALRWRTEKEVIVGKGQFECGSKKCNIKEGLRTWEVNFGYVEQDEKKNALVKLRLCPDCSVKLNYKSQRREIKRNKSLKRLQRTFIDDKQKGINEETKEIENDDKEMSDNVKLEEEKQTTLENETSTLINESEIWSAKQDSVEKSREEEFEEYLADLLL